MSRGQAHTLEAVVAGLLLLASVIFALQMTAVTPLSASTSSQHIENQQSAVARGVLTAADEEGALRSTVLYWNESRGRFHNTTDIGYYTNEPPNTTFGRMLNRSFDRNGISYNVYLVFENVDGDPIRKRLVYKGVPSDNAVRVARTITLVDGDRLRDHGGALNGTTVSESTTFYAKDVGRGVYNTVRVEVVAWRI